MAEAVIGNITLPLETIHAYCKKWKISEFALFDSVLREDFHAESDSDVLVQLQVG